MIRWEPTYYIAKERKRLILFYCLLVTTVACLQCLGTVLQAGQSCPETAAIYTADRQGHKQVYGSLEKTTSPQEFHVMLNLIEEDFKSSSINAAKGANILGGRGLRGRQGRRRTKPSIK